MLKFDFRTFTSFLLVLTFLMLVFSGVILFISPPGRIAHWSAWAILGLGKEGWGAIHILMAVVFLTGSLFHLLKFNWKIFLHYIRTRTGRFQHKTEAVASVGLFTIVLMGTIVGIPPFISLIQVHEEIKASWDTESAAPPVPHMELMSIRELAGNLQLSEDEIVARLQKNGLVVEGQAQTLKEIADVNRCSPLDVFESLSGVNRAEEPTGLSASPGSRGGHGRSTLSEIAQTRQVPLERILTILKSRGIEARSEERLRDVASRLQISPHDLLELFDEN